MPAPKLPPCTQPKHAWGFVKNVRFEDAHFGPRGSRIHIRYRGQYKCTHCSAVKYGSTQLETV